MARSGAVGRLHAANRRPNGQAGASGPGSVNAGPDRPGGSFRARFGQRETGRARGALSPWRHRGRRVPGRVEHHPDVLLRLVCRDPRSQLDGCGDSGVEIAHLDVPVQLHLRAPRFVGPRLGLIAGRGLHGEIGDSLAGVEGDEVRIGGLDRPPEECLVTSMARSRAIGRLCAANRRRNGQSAAVRLSRGSRAGG